MIRISIFCLALVCSSAAFAQNPITTSNSGQPIEISASQTLEWHQNDLKYIARGDVVVIQGDVQIKTDMLVADYREAEGGGFDIYQLTATGAVDIVSGEASATGDKAVYDVDSGLAVMTGDALRLRSQDQTITATEKFNYDVENGKLSAYGNAIVYRGKDKLSADTMTATFTEDAGGKRTLSKATATGNVVIKTPEETLTGDRGTYDAKTQIADIKGNVVITRGLNRLEGSAADINLATNISTMRTSNAANGGSGRVKGVFFPGNDGGNLSDLAGGE